MYDNICLEGIYGILYQEGWACVHTCMSSLGKSHHAEWTFAKTNCPVLSFLIVTDLACKITLLAGV